MYIPNFKNSVLTLLSSSVYGTKYAFFSQSKATVNMTYPSTFFNSFHKATFNKICKYNGHVFMK